MLEKQQKNKKGKKVQAVFYQVGFSTGFTIYCYFGLKFNDNTCCEVICKRRYNDNDIMITNKLPGMYFFFITVIFPIPNKK
jgi:hypothetical protein